MYPRLRIFALVLLLKAVSVIGNGDLIVQCCGDDGYVAFEKTFFGKCISSTGFVARTDVRSSVKKVHATHTYHCHNCVDIPLSVTGTVSNKCIVRNLEYRTVTPALLPSLAVEAVAGFAFSEYLVQLQPRSEPAIFLPFSTVVQLC